MRKGRMRGVCVFGSGCWSFDYAPSARLRTTDPLINSPLLYQLSYSGLAGFCAQSYLIKR